MAKLLNASTSFGLSAVAGTTYYSPAATTKEALSSTEARNQIIFRAAGTASRLRITSWANPYSGATTFKTRKNGADGGMSISIPAGDTGIFTDDSGTDTIAAADKLCYCLVAGSGSGTGYYINMSHDYAATSGSMQKWASNGPLTVGSKNTTWYEPITGDLSNQTTETSKQWKMRVAGTHRYLSAHVNTNTITSTTTIRTRKNGANGGCTLSIGSTATGFFEDTSGTDTIADGDLIDYQIVTGTWSGSKNLVLDNIASEFLPTNAEQEAINGIGGTNTVGGAANQTYRPLGYCGAGSAADQQTAEMPVVQGTSINRLRIYVSANNLSTDSTLYVRKNVTDTALTQVVSGGATGWFENTTDSVNLSVNDTFGYRIATGTGSSFTVDYVGTKMTITGTSTIKLTKDLKYTIVKTASALTKSAKYCVQKIVTATQKSVRYAIGKPYTPTKALQYAIRRTPSATTKDLKYTVAKTVSPLTKSLRYAIGKSIDVTKALKYTVPHIYSATKSLQYAIPKFYSATKSLAYAVWKAQTATKSVQYAVAKSTSVTKSLQYAVHKSISMTKSLVYAIASAIPSGHLESGSGYCYISTGTTYYFAAGHGLALTRETTEDYCKVPYRTAGTLSKLQAISGWNDLTAATTFRLRKNGADGNQNLSIPAQTTGRYVDNSNSDSVAAGDLINYKVVGGSGGTQMVMPLLGHIFKGTSDTVTRLIAKGATTDSSTNGWPHWYNQVAGAIWFYSQSEDDLMRTWMLAAGTFKNLCVRLTVNTANLANTMEFRKNNATVISIAIGANQTGLFENTSDTTTVAVDDYVCYAYDAGGGESSGSLSWSFQGVEFAPTDDLKMQMFATHPQTGLSASTRKFAWAAYLSNDFDTDWAVSGGAPYAGTITKITVSVYANTTGGSSTFRVRKNNANGNGSVSVPSNQTGRFQDPSGSDTVAAGDLICTDGTPPASGLSINYVDTLYELAGGAPRYTVEKSAKYCIIRIPSAPTKSLQYAVAKQNATTKSLQYSVGKMIAVTKDAKYTVWKRFTLTQDVRYAIGKLIPVTKSTQYTVWTIPAAMTKSVRYATGVLVALTRSAKYTVWKLQSITRQLQYVVQAAGTHLMQKSLCYQLTTEQFPALMLGR